MSKLLKTSSDDSAGYDAVLSSAESLLSGMGYVLNAAGSSVAVKPKVINATEPPPTCSPFDFTCEEPEKEPPENATEYEAVELDEESAKVRLNFINPIEHLKPWTPDLGLKRKLNTTPGN